MFRLLYVSTARQAFTPADLDQILSVSRRNNEKAGVTGLLIVGGKRVLQVLEGPELAVRATFARIGKDPRHFAVVQLASGPITERAFPGWAMGHQPGGQGGDGTPTETVRNLIAPIGDASLKGYFAGFAEARAAA